MQSTVQKQVGMNSFIVWLDVILLSVSVSIAIGCSVLVLCQVLLFAVIFTSHETSQEQ